MKQDLVPVRPSDIVVEKSKAQIRINWNDGSESIYSFEQLRAGCPCAECRAYKSDVNPLRQALIVSVALEGVQLVGNYAIQLTWDDGHQYGIFTWEYLRSME